MTAVDFAADWLQPLFGTWIDVALAACVGVAIMRDAVSANATARLSHLAWRAVILLGVGLVAYLCVATVAMTDTSIPDFPDSLWLVLTQSDFGSMIWVAAAAWIALVLGARLSNLPNAGPHLAGWLYLAGLIAFSYARAATGHAADHGFLSLAVGVHTLHILAGCAWAGSVGISVLLTPEWRVWPMQQRKALAHRLSTTATIAVPVVAISGLINAFRMLGHSVHLWGSTYLWILLAKVCLVAIAVALGSWNRWFWMKRLDGGQEAAARGFNLVLSVEMVGLIIVLALAARLGITMAPA